MRYLLFLLVFILFACNDSSIDSDLKPDNKVNVGIGGEDSLTPPSNYRIINGYLHYDFEGDSVEVQKKKHLENSVPYTKVQKIVLNGFMDLKCIQFVVLVSKVENGDFIMILR